MTTPIKNKAAEVRAWIDRVHADDGEVGDIDVKAYIKKRWPNLIEGIQQAIFAEVIL